jgi:YggT family protein
MLIIRIFGSWFQSFQQSSFFRFIAHYTDPYLNIFRRFIPPIGGVLDLSPILGFFVLQFLEWAFTRLLLML